MSYIENNLKSGQANIEALRIILKNTDFKNEFNHILHVL